MNNVIALFEPQAVSIELGKCDYYPTPAWLAERIIERYFPNLSSGDHVLEPSCGDGRFLDALPQGVRATGIEIQEELAALARAKGHNVIVGDFRTVKFPEDITCAIGNPPFQVALIDPLLNRLADELAPDRKVGFVLPSYFFQTHRHVEHHRAKWAIAVDMIPRDVFPGLSTPLAFAMFTRSYSRAIFGLAFYDEVLDVLSMDARVQQPLTENRLTWRAVVTDTLERLGGTATLKQLYAAIEPARPSKNQWWREKVRQIAQQCCVRVAPETYALAA